MAGVESGCPSSQPETRAMAADVPGLPELQQEGRAMSGSMSFHHEPSQEAEGTDRAEGMVGVEPGCPPSQPETRGMAADLPGLPEPQREGGAMAGGMSPCGEPTQEAEGTDRAERTAGVVEPERPSLQPETRAMAGEEVQRLLHSMVTEVSRRHLQHDVRWTQAMLLYPSWVQPLPVQLLHPVIRAAPAQTVPMLVQHMMEQEQQFVSRRATAGREWGGLEPPDHSVSYRRQSLSASTIGDDSPSQHSVRFIDAGSRQSLGASTIGELSPQQRPYSAGYSSTLTVRRECPGIAMHFVESWPGSTDPGMKTKLLNGFYIPKQRACTTKQALSTTAAHGGTASRWMVWSVT